jgi:hypothetical protein
VIADTRDKALAVLDSKINDIEDNLSDPRPDYHLSKRGLVEPRAPIAEWHTFACQQGRLYAGSLDRGRTFCGAATGVSTLADGARPG